MSGRKFKQFKRLTAAAELRAQLERGKATLEGARQAMPPASIDESAISAALDLAGAPRFEGDAAQLCAIAASESLDQAKLAWWIKDSHAGKEWTASALRAWCAKYRELLSHLSQPQPDQPDPPR
jgi:hypothetical protein